MCVCVIERVCVHNTCLVKHFRLHEFLPGSSLHQLRDVTEQHEEQVVVQEARSEFKRRLEKPETEIGVPLSQSQETVSEQLDMSEVS